MPWLATSHHDVYVGLARTINIRCIHGIFGREITVYTVLASLLLARTIHIRCIYTVLASRTCVYLCLQVCYAFACHDWLYGILACVCVCVFVCVCVCVCVNLCLQVRYAYCIP